MRRPASGRDFGRKTWRPRRHSSAIRRTVWQLVRMAPRTGARRPSQMPAIARSCQLGTRSCRASHSSRRTSTACISARAARGVIEYHGNILRDRCTVEGVVAERAAAFRHGLARMRALRRAAATRTWSGSAKQSRPAALLAAEQAATDCDAFLSIGTSALVYPAAGLGRAGLALRRDRHRNQPRADGSVAVGGLRRARDCRNTAAKPRGAAASQRVTRGGLAPKCSNEQSSPYY